MRSEAPAATQEEVHHFELHLLMQQADHFPVTLDRDRVEIDRPYPTAVIQPEREGKPTSTTIHLQH